MKVTMAGARTIHVPIELCVSVHKINYIMACVDVYVYACFTLASAVYIYVVRESAM